MEKKYFVARVPPPKGAVSWCAIMIACGVLVHGGAVEAQRVCGREGQECIYVPQYVPSAGVSAPTIPQPDPQSDDPPTQPTQPVQPVQPVRPRPPQPTVVVVVSPPPEPPASGLGTSLFGRVLSLGLAAGIDGFVRFGGTKEVYVSASIASFSDCGYTVFTAGTRWVPLPTSRVRPYFGAALGYAAADDHCPLGSSWLLEGTLGLRVRILSWLSVYGEGAVYLAGVGVIPSGGLGVQFILGV